MRRTMKSSKERDKMGQKSLSAGEGGMQHHMHPLMQVVTRIERSPNNVPCMKNHGKTLHELATYGPNNSTEGRRVERFRRPGLQIPSSQTT
jgi:hypothetical protein